MRVALYARYSTDNQRDASIAHQFRVCRAYAEKQGWQVSRNIRTMRSLAPRCSAPASNLLSKMHNAAAFKLCSRRRWTASRATRKTSPASISG